MKKNTVINLTYCHRKPERSFFWKGKQFPVCARCTGIHVGMLLFPIFIFEFSQISVWWLILLILPTYIDGMIQAYWDIESTNLRRFLTGFFSGVGTVGLLAIVGKSIANLILYFII